MDNKERILQFDLNGNFIRSFSSPEKAALRVGTTVKNILKVASGELSSVNNFVFKFARNYDDKRNQ